MRRNLCFVVVGLSAAELLGAPLTMPNADSTAERQTTIPRGALQSNSLSMQTETNLKQIGKLMKGSMDQSAERRILNIFRGSTAAELNELICGMPLHDFHKLMSDIDDRLIGPDNRTVFLNELSKERLGDLTVESRARLIGELQYHRTGRRDEKAIRDVFLGTKGADLTKLKKAVDHGGDYRDLQQLVFHDIDDSKIRGQLLEHFKKEGAAASGGQVKVLSDIDDTFYVNLKDNRYPRKTVYPGVKAFYAELDKGGGAKEDPSGDLMFLSARPYDRGGLSEHHTHEMLKNAGVHDATVLSGDFPHLINNELMARKKFENWKQVCQLYPEYGFVFVGDSGQGDAIFGAKAAAMPGTSMKRVFIHNVTDLNKAQRAHFSARGVHIFDTYVGAATEACKSGLISKEGLLRVATEAQRELAQVPFSSLDQKAAREQDLARDLDEAMRTMMP